MDKGVLDKKAWLEKVQEHNKLYADLRSATPSKLLSVAVDEVERLRRLVEPRADWHLHNWGLWCRGERLTEGFPDHSTCLENMGGCSSEDSSLHVLEREYEGWAQISDTILDDIDVIQRTIIANIYQASVWTAPRMNIDGLLTSAAAEFWGRAKKRGLS